MTILESCERILQIFAPFVLPILLNKTNHSIRACQPISAASSYNHDAMPSNSDLLAIWVRHRCVHPPIKYEASYCLTTVTAEKDILDIR